MPDPQRWPDRMRAIDAVFWTLGRAGAARPNTSVLLRFAAPLQERRVRAALLDLCEAVPRLRQRVVPVPLDVAPPEWIEDESFALDNHFAKAAAAATPLAFLAAVRRHIDAAMPEDRPLWRATFFAGAPGGDALLLDIHHCATDGLGISRILHALDGAGRERRASGSTTSLTPRLTTADALLWRGLQFGIEEAGESLTLVREAIADAASAPISSAAQMLRAAGIAGSAITRLLRPAAPTAISAARQRSRRLVTAEIQVAALYRASDAAATPVDAVVVAALSAGLAAAWHERDRRSRPIDVLLPVSGDDPLHPTLVATTIERASRSAGQQLLAVSGALERLGVEQRLRFYNVAARALQALPDSVSDAFASSLTSAGDSVHLTTPGTGRATRFAGERLEAIHCFPPLIGTPAIALSAHLYRRRLHLGIDVDLHTAPDPAEIVTAVHHAAVELRGLVARRQLP